MPVKMRLHRVGAKHQPSYRIVITPALTPRDGSYLDQVGFYNPVSEPATITIDNEKAIAWLRKGVQPTDRVARLLAKVDIDPAKVRKPEEVPAEPAAKRTRMKRAQAVAQVPDGIQDQPSPVEAKEVAEKPTRKRAVRKTPETESK